MIGEQPCPACGRHLELRHEAEAAAGAALEETAPRSGRRLRGIYGCGACAKDWESCPRCGGLVVEVVQELLLFRTPGPRQVRCLDCRSFQAEAGPAAGLGAGRGSIAVPRLPHSATDLEVPPD